MCREWLRRSNLLVLCAVVAMAGECARSTLPELAQLVLRQALENIPAEFVVCVAIDDRDADATMLRGFLLRVADI